MKIIAWNYRGLGNDAAVRGLLNAQKEEDPDILFLSETKMYESRIKGLRWKMGLANLIMKDCSETHGGGLAIFWRSGINLHVRGISCLYIDADVTEEDGFCVVSYWVLWRTEYREEALVMESAACP
jgi:exonuclease III